MRKKLQKSSKKPVKEYLLALGFVAIVIAIPLIVISSQKDTNKVSHAQNNAKVFFGGVLSRYSITDSATTNVLKQYGFNMLTPENELKMDETQPTATTYDFSKVDPIITFAKSNGMVMHGHTLFWHGQNPSWLTNGNYTPDQLAAIAQNRITTLLQHYPGGQQPGQFYSWDVFNEALDDNQPSSTGYVLRPYDTTFGSTPVKNVWANLAQSSAVQTSGYPNQVIWAFAKAREADLNHTIKLYYNDYNIEPWGSTKAKAAFNLVKDLHDRGLVDGVGLQMHLGTDWVTDPINFGQQVEATIQQYQSIGVDVAISEMDVNVTNNLTQRQADIYNVISKACAKYPNCVRFSTWGVTDRYTWLGSSAAPLLFDVNAQPKSPAWNYVQSNLAINPIGSATNTPAPTATPIPSDVTPPSVSITYPSNNASFLRGTELTMTASASDNVSVQRVEFYVNNSLKCTDTTASYSCYWKMPKSKATYYLKAVAYDTAGNKTTSSQITMYTR